MAKESLFNILENHVDFEDIIALDLFAGTGNISYELVSRGCPRVTAVDENNNCIKFIRDTATKLNMPPSESGSSTPSNLSDGFPDIPDRAVRLP